MNSEDFNLEVDTNSLQDNVSFSIQLDTKNDDDIKYIDITKRNGRTSINLKSQNYAIQEAASLGKRKELLGNYLNESFHNLNWKDQKLALELMKQK